MKSLFVSMTFLLCGMNLAFGQGLAFTYQGNLNDAGQPANGVYDLRLTLYDSTNLPGTIIAGPITNAATLISNGLFTVTLDFGNVFPGAARWLEIGVRTNGASSFSTLSPRQALTPTPTRLRPRTWLAGGSLRALSRRQKSIYRNQQHLLLHRWRIRQYDCAQLQLVGYRGRLRQYCGQRRLRRHDLRWRRLLWSEPCQFDALEHRRRLNQHHPDQCE